MGRAHAQAITGLGVPLTAVCDARPEALAAVGEEFGVPEQRRFDSADRLLDAVGEIDLVIIATTADMHADLTCLAAGAGARAVLCEKPLATSVADCERVIAVCEAAGTRLAVNHQMRFMDQYRLVRSRFEAGMLGRLASMNVVAGCFGLAMNGSHYVEAFMYLTGSRCVEASAWFSGDSLPNPRGPQFFDQAGEMRFLGEGGQRLLLSIGADQGHGMTVMYAGALGHLFVDELQGEMYVTTRKAEHRSMPPTRYGMPWDRERVVFQQADNIAPTRAVMHALATGAVYPDGSVGHDVIAALAACYASAESGNRPVPVDQLGDYHARTFPWA